MLPLRALLGVFRSYRLPITHPSSPIKPLLPPKRPSRGFFRHDFSPLPLNQYLLTSRLPVLSFPRPLSLFCRMVSAVEPTPPPFFLYLILLVPTLADTHQGAVTALSPNKACATRPGFVRWPPLSVGRNFSEPHFRNWSSFSYPLSLSPFFFPYEQPPSPRGKRSRPLPLDFEARECSHPCEIFTFLALFFLSTFSPCPDCPGGSPLTCFAILLPLFTTEKSISPTFVNPRVQSLVDAPSLPVRPPIRFLFLLFSTERLFQYKCLRAPSYR